MHKKGFTLIELLVVIAIIALLSSVVLASLNSARSKARDARRKEDLYEISNAVSSYYNQYGYLPRNSGWCTYISNATNSWGHDFQADISPSFIASVPLDPQSANRVGDYFYASLDSNSGSYDLCAILEQPTGKSYDFSGCSGGTVYNYCVGQ